MRCTVSQIYFGQIYCPSSGVNNVYTATGICHTSYLDCLLARSGRNHPELASRESA